MALRFLDDAGYSQGMVRDEPSWLIPQGGVYDSLNMLQDQPGILRQRGGSTALVSGSQTAFCSSIGFCYSADATAIEELHGYDGKTGNVYLISKTTGAATSLGAAVAGTVGRPARHFGFLFFPVSGSRTAVGVAGQTSSTTFTSGATASVTAADQQVTLTGADVTTNVKVGGVVQLQTATQRYRGRVVSIDTTKLFTVWPALTWTDAAIPIGGVTVQPFRSDTGRGGTCAASFQNRLLYGNTTDHLSVGSTLVTDRRVYYSLLPTESQQVVGINVNGATFADPSAGVPALNYFDVPGADPIVAMEPISDGMLLILTSTDAIIFQGNLVTQLATTSPTITFDIYPLGTRSGCLNDLSVHRTPIGLMWTGNEGVFAYWPPLRRNPAHTGIRNLMDGKILTYWQTLVNGSSFAVHGAAYVRNHYIVSGISNGVTFSLACNLANHQWTRLSGAGTDIFNGVVQPSNPQRVFAARWWDTTGAAPSMTNGQTVRLESMFDPYVAGATKTDSDATAVPMSVTTRVITGDAETQKLFQRGTVRAQVSSTTAGVTVTAQSKIDAADIDASSVRALGNLSNTSTLTITNATNANPIVVTTGTHGLQTDDFVDIDAVLGNTNANGRWRIAVINTTSFSLVGGIGNAAYTSGGKAKKVTESDYVMSTLNAGQGASLTIAGSPNNIEVHGVRLAVLEKPPVMSS